MGYGIINGTSTRNSFSTWNNTTICGYPALRGKNKEFAGAVLFISDDVALTILFKPPYESAGRLQRLICNQKIANL